MYVPRIYLPNVEMYSTFEIQNNYEEEKYTHIRYVCMIYTCI